MNGKKTNRWIALLLVTANSASSTVVTQRAADLHIAFQAEIAEVSDLGGSGSKFAVVARQDISQWLPSRTLGWGALIATTGAKGNASNSGSTATYRLRFARAGNYKIFFRAAVRNDAPISSADSFYVSGGWDDRAPVQENESGLGLFEYGWFLANSVGTLTVSAADLGRDLRFTIANREANLVLDKFVLIPASATPTTAALDAWTSPIEIPPDVTLLKHVVETPLAGHQFGAAVDLDGSLAIVAASGDGGEDDDGAVFVFSSATGELVSRFQDNSPEAVATGIRLTQFGRSVAISRGIAAVTSGFHFDIENYQNHAFLYDALTGGYITELIPTGTPEPVNGFTVDIEGDLAIVGAVHTTDIDTDENTEPGAAFLFRVPSGAQVGVLRAPGGRVDAHFGTAVRLSGNLAIVGAPFAENDGFGGAAYVFDVATGALITKLLPNGADLDNSFGTSVALEGGLAIVGDPASGAGAIYAFDALTGEQLYRLPAPHPVSGAQFGATVCLSEGALLVGAPAGCGLSSPPRAYLFDAADGALRAELAPADFDHGCYGSALVVDGDSAIIASAHFGDGSAYLHRNLGPVIPPPGVFQEIAGTVAIEAEHFALRQGEGTHAWTESTAKPGFAGTAAMAATPNLGALLDAAQASAPSTPKLTYRVNFSSAGTWRVWLRGLGETGADDSAYVGLNGVVQKRVAPAGDGTWRWNYADISLPAAGVHEVNVWMREDGFFLDRLVLAKNTNLIPSGFGPPESPTQ